MRLVDQHQIVRDGWPHSPHGVAYLRDYGQGHAMCTCGKVSDNPGSITFRVRWHAAHARMREAADSRRSS